MLNTLKARMTIFSILLLITIIAFRGWNKDELTGITDAEDEASIEQQENVTPPDSIFADSKISKPTKTPKTPPSLKGEQVIVFPNKEAYQTFLKQADSYGILLVDRIDELNAVSLKAQDAIRFDLSNLAIDSNQIVKNPIIPEQKEFDFSHLYPVMKNPLLAMGLTGEEDLTDWGSSVRIAVIDTGVSEGFSEKSKLAKEKSFIDEIPSVESTHADKVIKLLIKEKNLGLGLLDSSQVELYQILDAEGKGDVFTLAKAIIEATDSGVDIINLSLGSKEDSLILKAAIDYANAQGVVMLAAVGNDGDPSVTYPAKYPNVVGVTATDFIGAIPDFSNHGEGVAIAAPGFAIEIPDEEQIFFSGTSAAVPLASLGAAYLKSEYPALSSSEIKEKLFQAANDRGIVNNDPFYGKGTLDLKRLTQLEEPNIFDIAVSDIYVPQQKTDNQNFDLFINFQNRGTEFIPYSSSQVKINGQQYSYTINGLSPSESKSIKLTISSGQIVDGLINLEVDTTINGGLTDSNPNNDNLRATLTKNSP